MPCSAEFTGSNLVFQCFIGMMARLGELVNLNSDEIEDKKQSMWLLNPLHQSPKSQSDDMSGSRSQKAEEMKTVTTEGDSDEDNMQSQSDSSKINNAHSSSAELGQYSLIAGSLVFFFPALGGLLFGYDIGATSAAVSQLKSVYSGVEWSSVVTSSSSLQGIITATSTLGALIGSIACFRLADFLGRKNSLLLATWFYLSGAVLEVISGGPDWSAASGIAVLLLGRLIYGFGIGFAMNGAPAYIGEMAPSAIRGRHHHQFVNLLIFIQSESFPYFSISIT